ncbi:MAG: rhodanese-related sulfurtransferase [Pseudomonadota bacterium]
MYTVAALYKFTPFEAPEAIKPPLLAVCEATDVKGTLLLAREGLNGTIAGSATGIETVLSHIRSLPGCAEIDVKLSTATDAPFARMKVRLKVEIVTMRAPDADPNIAVGQYVAPKDWNALIAQDDVAVIDTRNDYEVDIGTFDGAVDPQTTSFGEFPAWWRANRDRFDGKRIAMFCTGGIRCEKATSFLKTEGVDDVYHLKGGILKYLEDVPASESRWTGHCFVFDGRVSVGHGLAEGPHHLCHACRMPLTDTDLTRPEYEPGVSCHQCRDTKSEEDRARYRERQRQKERSKTTRNRSASN